MRAFPVHLPAGGAAFELVEILPRQRLEPRLDLSFVHSLQQAVAGEAAAERLEGADHGFLTGEITVGLGWDRATVTLRADYYVLRSAEGVVARGRNGSFGLREGEGGWVVLASS